MSGINNKSKEKSAIVFNIQRHSIHDGPGIRTNVFLKGCPLSCIWCCNPESIKKEIEIGFDRSKCIKCKKCIEKCKFDAINPNIDDEEGYKIDDSKCVVCGKCIEVCPTSALSFVGRKITVDELLNEIESDNIFYKTSSGGVTFTGGEPLLQIDFIEEILKKTYENNISSSVETCGNVPWENFERIIPYVDFFLYDLKHMDTKTHKKYTGSENNLIISNLRKLSEKTDNIILRIPLIPGINDDDSNIKGIIKLVSDLNINEINLLPYHRLGIGKYISKKKDYHLLDLKDMQTTIKGREKIQKIKKMFEEKEIKVTVGG